MHHPARLGISANLQRSDSWRDTAALRQILETAPDCPAEVSWEIGKLAQVWLSQLNGVMIQCVGDIHFEACLAASIPLFVVGLAARNGSLRFGSWIRDDLMCILKL